MKSRPDLLDPASPPGLEVFQLTTNADLPSSHVYMEAQIFTLDSQRFILHESADAHGSDPTDPRHRYLLCDVETGSLSPITQGCGTRAPSMSPDGKSFYYFVVEKCGSEEKATLYRKSLEGGHTEIVTVIDERISGTPFRASCFYGLSTISSDGARLAISCFLGDGVHAGGPWGLLVFDLRKGSYELVLAGPSWRNMHPQYTRSLDSEKSHDILVQENHGNITRSDGTFERLTGGRGADVHVIRDDGQHLRNMPWGRDENEFCSGHQCWRGRSDWAITAATLTAKKERHLIEGTAYAHDGHNGLSTAEAKRNILSLSFDGANFNHFATDLDGKFLITDYRHEEQDALFLMQLGEEGIQPFTGNQFLLRPHASGSKSAHIHPFLSPDGKTAFFNSDESGQLQAYMVKNLPSF